MPLSRQCCVARAALEFQINYVTVCLAASYFQRLATYPSPIDAFHAYDGVLEYEKNYGRVQHIFRLGHKFGLRLYSSADFWLLKVYLVCLHIAVKLVSRPLTVPRKLGGGYCIRNMCYFLCGEIMSRREIERMEFWILARLGWDLMPRTPKISL